MLWSETKNSDGPSVKNTRWGTNVWKHEVPPAENEIISDFQRFNINVKNEYNLS